MVPAQQKRGTAGNFITDDLEFKSTVQLREGAMVLASRVFDFLLDCADRGRIGTSSLVLAIPIIRSIIPPKLGKGDS